MDEIERLRRRRSDFGPSPRDLGVGGTARFLGKVTSTGSALGAGKFAIVNPAIVLGAESEGTPATIAIDTSIAVPVYQVDALATGDFVVCRFVDYRWVATKRLRGGTTPPTLVNIPGCFCQGTPLVLDIKVYYPPGESAATYQNAYRDGQLAYYTTPPSYLPPSAFGGSTYYSTQSWINDSGAPSYYRLSCSSSQYALGVGQFSGGLWQAPGQIYTWAVGGAVPVNFCSPFSLTRGRVQPGIPFNGRFEITDASTGPSTGGTDGDPPSTGGDFAGE